MPSKGRDAVLYSWEALKTRVQARMSKTLLRVVDAQLSAYITWSLLLGLYWGLIVTALNANPYRRERPERERDI